jgi:hypothetical protein
LPAAVRHAETPSAPCLSYQRVPRAIERDRAHQRVLARRVHGRSRTAPRILALRVRSPPRRTTAPDQNRGRPARQAPLLDPDRQQLLECRRAHLQQRRQEQRTTELVPFSLVPHRLLETDGQTLQFNEITRSLCLWWSCAMSVRVNRRARASHRRVVRERAR